MISIWNFLKELYYDIFELWDYYLKIEGEIQCHIFSVLFILIMILFLLLTIKTAKDVFRIRKDRKRIKKRIDKLLLGILEDGDKKTKNI